MAKRSAYHRPRRLHNRAEQIDKAVERRHNGGLLGYSRGERGKVERVPGLPIFRETVALGRS